ncbi:MAG TPA: hypothetical protein VF033_08460 [Steroidobacteraceae bacterium]
MITDRGPTARRGRQFSNEQVPQLLSALNKAAATLRKIQGVTRPGTNAGSETADLRQLDKEELEALRRRTSSLLTDLRAELRRRGHF